jgi:zinc transport system ATP-binding protein
MADIIVKIENLIAGYQDKIVLNKVNLDILQDDFIAIIGPNGGGKTTFLKTMLGLIPAMGGNIHFFKDNNKVPAIPIGYLPQYHTIDKRFPLRVFDVLHSGFMNDKLLFKRVSKTEKLRVNEIAEMTGITELLQKPIGNLSGGQLQRVFLGRAIVNKPRLLILDEPSTYVDNKFEGELYEILKDLNSQMAILMVSHDLGTIFSHVKSIACINKNLYYHKGNELTEAIVATYNCPIDILTHGHVPHRVLPLHSHDDIHSHENQQHKH